MTETNQTEDLLEKFLDGLMSDAEAAQFLKTVDADELAQQQSLQADIDASLRGMFQFEPLDERQVTRQAFETGTLTERHEVSDRGTASLATKPTFDRRLVQLVLAASLLAITAAGLWWMNQTPNMTMPFVQQRSLASLYTETVERGFQPYYNCEDDQRFADTFAFRQGQGLALGELPDGTRMLGLSYLGGISRDATAMLGEVDGTPVMVFVDKIGAGKVDTSTVAGSDLNVFLVERDGLVFVEVTPLSSPKLIKHFQLATE